MFRYSAEMIEFLRANKGSMTMRELTQKFNATFGQERSLNAIRRLCCSNGMGSKNRYSAEMIEFLRENKASMTMRELTKKFNDTFGQKKSCQAIHSVCFNQGLCPQKRYSAEMIEFLRENKVSMTMRELTQKFNDTFGQKRSVQAINSICFKNGLPPKIRYPDVVINFIKNNVSKMTYKELSDSLNERFNIGATEKGIGAFCFSHNMCNGRRKKKSEYFVFSDEMISFIKKHAQYMSRSKLTRLFNEHFGTDISVFILTHKCHKIGLTHIYPNVKEISSETIKKGHGYFIKTKDGWKPKQRILWAQKNGPIPPKCYVLFADGDNTNFDEDNLILVTGKEHVHLNRKKLRFSDADRTKAGLTIVKLLLEIEKRKEEVE